MTIEDELSIAKKKISTESYSMSIGELISMYKEGELLIHPEFQRFFRWTTNQKSRLFESLVLGLPIPPIFVLQRGDGKWEIIDGLQRVSTILELIGILKDRSGKNYEQLKLTSTKYLPSLSGYHWDSTVEDNDKIIPDTLKLNLRRARLDVNIVLSANSDTDVKYELFDRLNTGASFATPQEVRNCLIIMENESFFNWLSELASYGNFKACLPISENQAKQQYDMELLVRFLVLQKIKTTDFSGVGDIHTFLNEKILAMASSNEFDQPKEAEIFKKTFDLLHSAYEDDVFRKYIPSTQKHVGPIFLPAFESIAIGVAHKFSANKSLDSTAFKLAYEKLWTEKNSELTSFGMNSSTRLAKTIKAGRETFGNED